MEPLPSIALAECKGMYITPTLQARPLGEQTVPCLLKNEHALDTARGSAAPWVRSDEIIVQAALDQLIACGVITPYPFTSSVLYGVTRDQEIRPWLRKARGGERPAGWPTNANRRHDAFA